MDWLDKLRTLSELPGPPGMEDKVREFIRSEIEGYAEEVFEDRLGNLYALKGDGPRVMFAAHMDEVSLMVTYLDGGYLRVTNLGGLVPNQLLAKKVVVHGSQEIYGIIGATPAHLRESKEVEMDDLYVDVGAKSEEELRELGIRKGTFITFDTRFTYQPSTGVVMGKAFDDRMGCLVLLEAFKKVEPEYSLYAVFTVQEERGLRGATVAGYRVNPELAFALEGTIANDTPATPSNKVVTKSGGGPAIRVMDRRLITNPRLLEFMMGVAERNSIRYQLQISPKSTTDASVLNLAREGVPAGVISVPSRYIHTPVSLARVDDVEETIKYVQALMQEVPKFLTH